MNTLSATPALGDTPIMRINGELISRSIGSMVSIVGTVENIMGNTVVLRTSDEKSVNIIASNGFSHPIGRVVEIIGTVEGNGSIIMQYESGFDGTYNANAYNKLVEYMNGKFNAELF